MVSKRKIEETEEIEEIEVPESEFNRLCALVDTNGWKSSLIDSHPMPDTHIVATTLADGQRKDEIEWNSVKLKPRLMNAMSGIDDCFLLAAMASRMDLLYPLRVAGDDDSVAQSVALHSLNTVYEIRDRILKNTLKINADNPGEFRDQGFTRPSVLILVPFRSHAYTIIQCLMNLSGCPVQENKKRFMDEFQSETIEMNNKSTEFNQLFAGNTDDCFKIGIKLSRKHMKLYSAFYSSDIIIASPLGLTLTMDKGSADFLSSIQTVVLDYADIFLMQNWDHVKTCFAALNSIPSDAHGCDFSRVKPYFLDGKAQYMRQNIILSRFVTPELNALANASNNIVGRLRFKQHNIDGAINSVTVRVPQVFQRIPHGQSVTEAPDIRFTAFTTTKLASLRKSVIQQSQTLVVVPSYFDFVRLRNYMVEHDYDVAAVSEYSSRSDADRCFSRFATGDVSFLLYTERAHFFRRRRIKNVRHVAFYQVPVNPSTYFELLNMVETADGNEDDGASCSVMYSALDKLALERVVGSHRLERMLKGSKEAFMFSL